MNSLMTTFIGARSSTLHAPPAHRARLDHAKDHIFDDEADHDDGQQPGEHVGYLELVLVLIDEPAQATRSRRYAEHQLRRDECAPGERPTDLEPRQDARKRRGNQDA